MSLLANRVPPPRRVAHAPPRPACRRCCPSSPSSSLGSAGVYIGTDAFSRSPFYFDPIRMYLDGLIGDPNILVIGRLGYGKSALMKALSRRLNVVGYSTIYLDPKGETTPLARAFGVEPLRLATGGELRLNPLDEKLTSATGLDPTRERELLMRAVLPVMLERPLRPAELRIVSEVVREVVDGAAPRRRCATSTQGSPPAARSPPIPPTRSGTTSTAPRARSSTRPPRRGWTSTPRCWRSTCGG